MSSNVILIDVYPMRTAVLYQDGNARRIKDDLCCFLFIFSSYAKRESWSRPQRDFRPNERDKCKTQLGHVDSARCIQLVSSCNRMRASANVAIEAPYNYKRAIKTMRDVVKHLKLIQ